MPTVSISTSKMSSGIDYAWDRDWDIKTVEDARSYYLSLRDKLANIPATLAKMEKLAAQDGFALPTEDFAQLVDDAARKLLQSKPKKILLLEEPEDGPLSWGTPVIMHELLYHTKYNDVEQVATLTTPTRLVDGEGRPWAERNLSTLAQAYELLVNKKYIFVSVKGLGDYLDQKYKQMQDDLEQD